MGIIADTHDKLDAIGDREKTWVINPGECCGYLTGRKTVALLDFELGAAQIVAL